MQTLLRRDLHRGCTEPQGLCANLYGKGFAFGFHANSCERNLHRSYIQTPLKGACMVVV